MKNLKLWCVIDDMDVGLMFQWDEVNDCWVCRMEDDFMKELGALPVDKEDD